MRIVDCNCCEFKGLEIDGDRFICDKIGEDFSVYMATESCSDFELSKNKKESFKEVVAEEIENIYQILEVFKESK